MAQFRLTKRVVLALGSAVAIAIAALPWGLYALGLHYVDGRPTPPAQVASSSERAVVWMKARGTGLPTVPELSPYTYLLEHGAGNKAGVLVAWWVASEYLAEHRQKQGMFWWHLSGAALTIWLTRNWSADELLTVAARRRGNAG
jgi:hypothetical protein